MMNEFGKDYILQIDETAEIHMRCARIKNVICNEMQDNNNINVK